MDMSGLKPGRSVAARQFGFACVVALSGCTGERTPTISDATSASPAGEITCRTDGLLVFPGKGPVLGPVRPAERVERSGELHNPGSVPVEVASVESSCDCFTVTLGATTVEPGGRVPVRIVLDLSHDPKFAGQLRLEATGYTPTRAVAFAIRVDVDVDVTEAKPNP